jgi:hypothetical protein
MDSCECPSDIGRIPGKIASGMANFKAIEWRNWMTIFAVPAVRRLMTQPITLPRAHAPRPPLLLPEHVTLLLAMQAISAGMQAYYITEKQIHEMHENIVSVLTMISDWFGPGTVKPNTHASIHLKEMLLDYGPSAGWWCYSYERFNGLVASVPHNTGYMEVCLMRRHLLREEVSEAVLQRHRALHDGSQRLDGPGPEDYEHLVQLLGGSSSTVSAADSDIIVQEGRTAGNRRQVTYQWASQESFFRLHQNRYDSTTMIEALNMYVGCEEFPGVLHRANIARYQYAAIDEDYFHKVHHIGSHRQVQFKEFVAFDTCYRNLRWWYFVNYGKGSLKDKADLAQFQGGDEKVHETLMDKHKFTIDLNITICSRLDLGGETYGCRLSQRSIRTSYVIVAYVQRHGSRSELLRWGFAQVQFFFEHTYCGKVHRFMVLKYYNVLQPPQTANFTLFKEFRDSFEDHQFPVLKGIADVSRQDVLPIHRLVGRWIPGKIDWAPGTRKEKEDSGTRKEKEDNNITFACPTASRLHS